MVEVRCDHDLPAPDPSNSTLVALCQRNEPGHRSTGARDHKFLPALNSAKNLGEPRPRLVHVDLLHSHSLRKLVTVDFGANPPLHVTPNSPAHLIAHLNDLD